MKRQLLFLIFFTLLGLAPALAQEEGCTTTLCDPNSGCKPNWCNRTPVDADLTNYSTIQGDANGNAPAGYPYVGDRCVSCCEKFTPCGVGQAGEAQCWVDHLGYAKGNCTSWAAYRLNENTVTARTIGKIFGHAYQWDEQLLGYITNGVASDHSLYGRSLAIVEDNTPQVGDIAQWNAWETSYWKFNQYGNLEYAKATGSSGRPTAPAGFEDAVAQKYGAYGYGHVAYVEAVNPDGTVVVSQYDGNVCNFSIRTLVAPRYLRISHTLTQGPTVGGAGDPAPSIFFNTETDALNNLRMRISWRAPEGLHPMTFTVQRSVDGCATYNGNQWQSVPSVNIYEAERGVYMLYDQILEPSASQAITYKISHSQLAQPLVSAGYYGCGVHFAIATPRVREARAVAQPDGSQRVTWKGAHNGDYGLVAKDFFYQVRRTQLDASGNAVSSPVMVANAMPHGVAGQPANWDSVFVFPDAGAVAGTRYRYEIRSGFKNDYSLYDYSRWQTASTYSCATASNLFTIASTVRSAVIGFTAQSGAPQYMISYSVQGSGIWNTAYGTSSTFININGLSANTSYVCKMKVQCANNTWSDESEQYTFTTPERCPKPVLSAGSETKTSARIDWGPQIRSTNTYLYYRVNLFGTFVSKNVTGLTGYTLTDLEPGTEYEAYMYSYCSDAGESVTTEKIYFETLPDCYTPHSLAPAFSYATSAYFSFKASNGMDSYELNWREEGSTGAYSTRTSTYANGNQYIGPLTPGTRYEVTVRALCPDNGQWTPYAVPTIVETKPACPATSPYAGNIQPFSVDFSWAPEPRRNKLNLYYKKTTDPGYTMVELTNYNGAYTLGDLSPGTRYVYYTFSYCQDAGQWTVSPFTYFETEFACVDPENLRYTTVNATGAWLYYDSPGGMQSYKVLYRKDSETQWSSKVVTYNSPHYLNPLEGSTTYQAKVQTQCTDGTWMAESNEISFTTKTECPDPYIYLDNVSETSIRLTWPPQVRATTLRVYYRKSTETTWTNVNVTSTTGYTINNLDPGSLYYYYMYAYCTDASHGITTPIEYTYTHQACIPPTTHTFSNILANSARVSWGAHSAFKDFRIQYKTTAATSWSAAIQTGDVRSYTLTGLAAGTGYDVRFSVKCEDGTWSAYGASKSFTTVSNCPAISASHSGVTTNSAQIAWGGPQPRASQLKLYYRLNNTGSYTQINVQSLSSYTLTGLEAGKTYQYYLYAYCNDAGNDYTTPVRTFSTQTGCSSPGGVYSGNVKAYNATVYWSAVSGAGSYDVYWRLRGSTGAWNSANTTATSRYLSGLSASTQYEYKVGTRCSNGTTLFGGVYYFTTMAVCPTPGPYASSVSTTSAYISWSPQYRSSNLILYWRPSYSSTWSQRTVTGSTGTTLSGLGQGTTYYYYMYSYCSDAGSSATSPTYTFATKSDCPTPFPYASSITSNSAYVSWSPQYRASELLLYYRPSWSSTWTTVNVTGTTGRTISSLGRCTKYYYYLRSYCGDVGQYKYSATNSFNTPDNPITPSPYASNITGTSAYIGWGYLSGATSVYLYYKPTTYGSWVNKNVTGLTSTTITGLYYGTQYQYYMYAYYQCGSTTTTYRYFSTKSYSPYRTGELDVTEQIDEIHLLEAWPNPADAEDRLVTFAWELPEAQEVYINILDLQGREVYKITEGKQPAGRHEQETDLTALPAGVYLYQLRTESGEKQSKRLLLK